MARRSKYRFKTRAEYEVALNKLEDEKFQHFVALHETLNERDYTGPFDYKNVVRESDGHFEVSLVRPLAGDGGTVLIREKSSTSTFTYVHRFEDWHKTIQDRIREGLIPMHSDEWPLVGIATKLWDARRILFDAVIKKAS